MFSNRSFGGFASFALLPQANSQQRDYEQPLSVPRGQALACRLLAISRIFALLLALPLLGSSGAQASEFSQHFLLLSKPRPAPIFTFQDEHGQSLSLKDFRGRFVLLNLWATWCATCASEMPSLEALQRRFDPSRLTVIALSVDRNGLPAVQSFYHRHGVSGLAPYLDPDSLSIDALDAHYLPTTVFIDPRGREIGRIKGGVDWSDQSVIDFFEEHMGTP